MRALVLAAGEGRRLRPLTLDRPKCLVEVFGRPILDHVLDALAAAGVDEIGVVGGYRLDVLRRHLEGRDVTVFENPEFDRTNMVATLFCARPWLDDDLVVTYADIVYRPDLMRALLADPAPAAIVVDTAWRDLWALRMEDPLADAETLRLSKDGDVLELGKKPKSYAEIEGQYMGLLRFRGDVLRRIVSLYDALDPAGPYDGKDKANMYMTSLVQLVVDRLHPVRAVRVRGGWLEVDSVEDLEVYRAAGPGLLG